MRKITDLPDDYDYDIDGAVELPDGTFAVGGAVQALRPEARREREADERLRERQAAEAKRIRKAEEEHGPWLIRWERARADLERQERETLAELAAAVRADRVGSAFIRLLALQKAKDVGREVAKQKRAEVKGASAPGGSGFRHPTPFEELMNKILQTAAGDVKGLLSDAIAGRLETE